MKILLIVLLGFLSACNSDMKGACLESYGYLTKGLNLTIKEKKFFKLFLPGQQSDTYIFNSESRFNVEKSYLAMSCGDSSVSIEGEFTFRSNQAGDLLSTVDQVFFFNRGENGQAVAKLRNTFASSQDDITKYLSSSSQDSLNLTRSTGKVEMIFHMNQIGANQFTLAIVVKEDR